MTSKRKQYTSEFKFKAVMESFQRDTTIEGKRREQERHNDPAESPEELKKIIGELTVQNELLKKSRGLLGH